MSHNHSHCHDESHSHSPDHSHDHSHGTHDHSDDITPALQNHIFSQIDFDGIRTLNEAVSGSGRAVLMKTWAQRMDATPEIESDADEQLILHIPFTGQIRMHSLHLRTTSHPSAPLTLHLFSNHSDPLLDFDTASSATPTQTLTLACTSEVQDIPVKRALFSSCRSLTLFVEDNWGRGEEDVSRVGYVGLKGDWMELKREAVEVLYESAARPSDHKVKGEVGYGVGSGLGGGRRGF